MGKKRRKRKGIDATASSPPRGFAQACGEAVPDVLALGVCLLAWINPGSVHFDIIALAAPLFFVQTALAIPQTFSGVLRLREHEMSRAQKAGFLIWPIIVLLPLVWGLFGHWALLSLLLVSGEALWRALTGRVDTSAPVRGAWITYTEGDDGVTSSTSMVSVSANASARRSRGFKQWRVEAGHMQVMATLTLTGAVLTVFVVLFTEVGAGGIAPAHLASSAWPQTLIGKIVPAHDALAAGVALFGMRTFAQFEGVIGAPEPPTPDIADDPVLREIVEKVERKSSKR
jgi:hypothetical protein